MKKRIVVCALLTLLATGPVLLAQEQIEIVDKNGQPVGKAQVQVVVNQGDDDDGVQSANQFKIEGDKIIIVEENGETREIDIAGAQSVSVQQSVKTVNKDGEQQTVRQGKAIIRKRLGER